MTINPFWNTICLSVDVTICNWRRFHFSRRWRRESNERQVSETFGDLIDVKFARSPLFSGLLLPTPSFLLPLLALRLLLALGYRLPVLRTLGCILLELPTVVGLRMAELAMRTLLVSGF